ncbi:FAD-dependent monooxygenase [Allonocardiopsis opalescens]|uniref:Salicylate hydroxylase n=1 Tax=Allonocardiopsis opalescens TaxID=1144618 RepID=A0A2T0Q0I1_9ACTN|nr:FAD-dependent monooxygenase [Allonocardiopsis opalescens]PRX97299.1 salicylate hydroxylase [Allonocardiopsis opalescens]
MTSADEILIVGGGIGGLATALALTRTGRRARVLERAAEFGEIGAGLQLAPNATRLLEHLGVLDEVISAGVQPRRLVFRSAVSGEELTSLPLDADFEKRYGGPYVVVHRGDLLGILLEACRRAGVELHTSAHVTGVDNLDEAGQVTLADGSTRRGAAVVAADGVRSQIRRRFSADEPVGSGYVAYRGTIPAEQAHDHLHPTDVVLWIGPGIHYVHYPLRSGTLYNQVAVFRSPGYAAGEAEWGTPEELDAAFASAVPHIREGLTTLWRDRRWAMEDREPISTWTDGRIALLGDAAHPMLQYLAQGACQALEDAVCLAGALRGGDDGIPAALRAYQDVRAPRTARLQRTARLWGDMWHVDGVSMLMRDELFRSRDVHDHRYVEWLYGTEPHEAGPPMPAPIAAVAGVG